MSAMVGRSRKSKLPASTFAYHEWAQLRGVAPRARAPRTPRLSTTSIHRGRAPALDSKYGLTAKVSVLANPRPAVVRAGTFGSLESEIDHLRMGGVSRTFLRLSVDGGTVQVMGRCPESGHRRVSTAPGAREIVADHGMKPDEGGHVQDHRGE